MGAPSLVAFSGFEPPAGVTEDAPERRAHNRAGKDHGLATAGKSLSLWTNVRTHGPLADLRPKPAELTYPVVP